MTNLTDIIAADINDVTERKSLTWHIVNRIVNRWLDENDIPSFGHRTHMTYDVMTNLQAQHGWKRVNDQIITRVA